MNPNRISPMAIDFGLPDTSPQCSFQLRAPHSNNEAQCKEMVDTLENSPLLQNMTLGFVSLHKKADGTLLTKGVAHATTEIKYAPPSVKLWLAYEKPALLLRDDLNDGERLALQTAVANTLVHERMHAYSFAKNHRDVRASPRQLFPMSRKLRYPLQGHVSRSDFLDKTIANIDAVAIANWSRRKTAARRAILRRRTSCRGWMFDGKRCKLTLAVDTDRRLNTQLWGGCLREIGLAPSGLTFGLGLQSWPDPGVSTRTALLEPPIPTFKTLLPLAVPYFESLHQSDFWSNMVRSFHSFRPRPIYVTEHNQTRILLSVKRRNVQGPWERLAVPPQSPFLAEPSNAARTIRETLSYMPDQRANNYRFNIALNQFRTMLQIRDEKAALILDQFELIARIDILQGGYNTYESLLKITGWIEELCRINETTFVPIKQVDRASTQFGGKQRRPARSIPTNRTTVASREILNFNRGLRMILDEISGAGFQEIDRQINALKTIIDSIRTYFTQSSQHPLGISAAEDSNIAAQEEANHQTALANTKTRTSTDDLEASRVICTRVTGSVTSTLLTKCEARIILGANDSVDLDTRIMQLTRVVETLQAMLSPPGRAQEQQQYLDSAQLQLVALNQQKQQGQPPGGTTFIS